jgi:outer membrane protein assembly factor BamA
VGRGRRSGVPSIDEVYDPVSTPGLGEQPTFFRAGALVQYDYRDLPSGPRTGGNYYAEYTRYWDQTLNKHDFNYLDTAVEQYIPYWNKTRVIAIRLAAVMTFTREDQTVPFYLEPWLGGNEYLRGFARYRYYDQNAILLAAEHRWHLFSGGYGALFFEAGKVAPKPSELNLKNLQYAGGIGLRFTIRDAVIMRIDNAVSREGYRFIWTFSNMW